VVDRAAGIVCDAKSGVSGAGRKPRLSSSFCEVTENFSAYSILRHRHVPEVLQISGLEEREFSFTAQLLPLDRGILETIYFRATGVASAEDLVQIYEKRYAGEPFVRIYQPGHFPTCTPWRAPTSATSASRSTRRAAARGGERHR
jgi:N-acetyl-gamma-glutamyl-phosphate reductase